MRIDVPTDMPTRVDRPSTAVAGSSVPRVLSLSNGKIATRHSSLNCSAEVSTCLDRHAYTSPLSSHQIKTRNNTPTHHTTLSLAFIPSYVSPVTARRHVYHYIPANKP